MDDLTNYEQQQLQDLAGLPAFQLLIDQFQQYENGLLDQLATAKPQHEMLETARHYQLVRNVREVLAGRPAAVAAELARLRDLQSDDWDEARLNRDVTWQGRWNPTGLDS